MLHGDVNSGSGSEQDIEKIERMFEELKIKMAQRNPEEPLTLLELVIAPTFAETAENVLSAAHLANDGRIAMKKIRKFHRISRISIVVHVLFNS